MGILEVVRNKEEAVKFQGCPNLLCLKICLSIPSSLFDMFLSTIIGYVIYNKISSVLVNRCGRFLSAIS